jgi:hypothetical protein
MYSKEECRKIRQAYWTKNHHIVCTVDCFLKKPPFCSLLRQTLLKNYYNNQLYMSEVVDVLCVNCHFLDVFHPIGQPTVSSN